MPLNHGVAKPATGVYTYSWTPATSLDTGDYLVTWSGTDPELDVVSTSEVVTLVAASPLAGLYATTAELKRRQMIPDTNAYLDDDLEDALRARPAARQHDHLDRPARRGLASPPGPRPRSKP